MFISTRNSRIGLALFGAYLVVYGGFVVLAAFSPETMEATPLAGVNLAIWYGFGLIVVAIVLALVYGWACRSDSLPLPQGEGWGEGESPTSNAPSPYPLPKGEGFKADDASADGSRP
jgi:uncharacterized membrane protein (DUF485 family)